MTDEGTTYTREELTFNEHIAAAAEIAHAARADSTLRARADNASVEERGNHSAAARDLSISLTALEDAATRYNSARYQQKGVWKRADPDKASA